MLTKISWLCFFLAAILLVGGGIWAFTPQDGRDSNKGLIVEKTPRDLGEQAIGSHILEVRVRNTGSRPHRILGIPNG